MNLDDLIDGMLLLTGTESGRYEYKERQCCGREYGIYIKEEEKPSQTCKNGVSLNIIDMYRGVGMPINLYTVGPYEWVTVQESDSMIEWHDVLKVVGGSKYSVKKSASFTLSKRYIRLRMVEATDVTAWIGE